MPTRRTLVFAPLLAAASPVLADDLPSGSMTIIVSFPAGGSIDVVMRSIAGKLQQRVGKPVIVENRAGAGGVIATEDVIKAAPDGRTLLASASSLAANPTLFKSLPFNTLKDLQAVSLIFRTPLVLVVNPKLPVRSIAGLIALLESKPGQINTPTGAPARRSILPANCFRP